MDYRKLIERLQSSGALFAYGGHTVVGSDYAEAAAAIEALLAERERLSDALGRANADAARIEAERNELLQIVKRSGDCDLCVHGPTVMPCGELFGVMACEGFTNDRVVCCECDGDRWEWRGLEGM